MRFIWEAGGGSKALLFLILVDAKMNDSFAAVLGIFPGILFQCTFSKSFSCLQNNQKVNVTTLADVYFVRYSEKLIQIMETHFQHKFRNLNHHVDLIGLAESSYKNHTEQLHL